MPLLCISDVAVRFDGIIALAGVSFDVAQGQICGVIGPNGSGKSTLFNCISGLTRCDRGDIRFGGTSLTRAPRHRRAAMGIGRTFQNLALFRSMSVRDNVLVGAHTRGRSGFLANALRLPGARQEEAAAAGGVADLLARLSLEGVADRPIGTLPFATQKRVELARALMARPKLLLLDEPAGGLAHGEVAALAKLLLDIARDFTLAILLVEHHMGLVMQVSDKVVALEFGRKIAEGPPSEVQHAPDVIRAYLGENWDAA